MDRLLYELLKHKTIYLIVNNTYIEELYVADVDHQVLWCRSEIEDDYCQYHILNTHNYNISWFLSEEDAMRRLGYSF